jgi:aminopeptidase N
MSSIPATIAGARTDLPAAIGRPAPQLVFPNNADHAYAKVALDAGSLAYVRENFDRIHDALLRQLLWMSLWEMVRDTHLRSTDFLAIARRHLDAEPDLDIVKSVLERVGITLSRFVPEPRRAQEARAVVETALANLRAASSSDGQIIWARAAIASAASADDVGRLLQLIDGAEPAAGFEFDQEMRWETAIKAAAFELPGADQRLATEQARDRSDRGQRALIRAAASTPQAAAKAETWRRIHGEGYGSFHFTRAAMQGFVWLHQSALVQPYGERFFEQVREVFETRDHPFARAYMLALYPGHSADPAVVARTHELLATLDGRLPTLSRQLAEAADELDRSIRVRRYAAG